MLMLRALRAFGRFRTTTPSAFLCSNSTCVRCQGGGGGGGGGGDGEERGALPYKLRDAGGQLPTAQ